MCFARKDGVSTNEPSEFDRSKICEACHCIMTTLGLQCRNSVAQDGWMKLPFRDLFGMFQTTVKKLPDAKCLGWRVGDEYCWDNYKVRS